MTRSALAVGFFVTAIIVCSCKEASIVLPEGGADMESARRINGKLVSDVFFDPPTLLMADAACRGDRQGITRAIADGARANEYGVDDVSPLLWAMLCKSPKGVEGLLAEGADPNLPFHDCTLMCIAAGRNDTATLKLLLSHGGDPNARYSKSDLTALRLAFAMAIDTENWDNYYALLEAGADINLVHLGHTVAFDAATLNRYEKVRELLDRGYRAGLDYLGRLCQGEPLEGSLKVDAALIRERDQVLEQLKTLGVKFPVPAGVDLPPDTSKVSPT